MGKLVQYPSEFQWLEVCLKLYYCCLFNRGVLFNLKETPCWPIGALVAIYLCLCRWTMRWSNKLWGIFILYNQHVQFLLEAAAEAHLMTNICERPWHHLPQIMDLHGSDYKQLDVILSINMEKMIILLFWSLSAFVNGSSSPLRHWWHKNQVHREATACEWKQLF